MRQKSESRNKQRGRTRRLREKLQEQTTESRVTIHKLLRCRLWVETDLFRQNAQADANAGLAADAQFDIFLTAVVKLVSIFALDIRVLPKPKTLLSSVYSLLSSLHSSLKNIKRLPPHCSVHLFFTHFSPMQFFEMPGLKNNPIAFLLSLKRFTDAVIHTYLKYACADDDLVDIFQSGTLNFELSNNKSPLNVILGNFIFRDYCHSKWKSAFHPCFWFNVGFRVFYELFCREMIVSSW